MAAKPGEVWLADLGLAAKTRPVIILSREDCVAEDKVEIIQVLHKSETPSFYQEGDK